MKEFKELERRQKALVEYFNENLKKTQIIVTKLVIAWAVITLLIIIWVASK